MTEQIPELNIHHQLSEFYTLVANLAHRRGWERGFWDENLEGAIEELRVRGRFVVANLMFEPSSAEPLSKLVASRHRSAEAELRIAKSTPKIIKAMQRGSDFLDGYLMSNGHLPPNQDPEDEYVTVFFKDREGGAKNA